MLTLARQQQRQNIRWSVPVSFDVWRSLAAPVNNGSRQVTGLLLVANCSSGNCLCTLAVLLVGAALAISGAVMQALFENPLAEPGLLAFSQRRRRGAYRRGIAWARAIPNWALGLCAISPAAHPSLYLCFARRHLSTRVGYRWRCIRDYL